MRRQCIYVLGGCFGLFTGVVHAVTPPAPCLARYAIARRAWGQLPAGMPEANGLFQSVIACDAAHQYLGEEFRTGQSCTIGTLKASALRRYAGRTIVDSLLYGGQIETSLHLRSTFCRVEETDTTSRYVARFHGEHEYCTNECVSAPLDFTVVLDKTTRIVTVQHR